MCGGFTGDLPICQNKDSWFSAKEIMKRTDLSDNIIIIDKFTVEYSLKHLSSIKLNNNVFIIPSSGIPGLLQCRINWPQNMFTNFVKSRGSLRVNLAGALIEAIAQAWSVNPDILIQENTLEKEEALEIGLSDNGILMERGIKIIKPIKVQV